MAKLHLNAKNVENLKPGVKQEDYWDTALPKFGVRVSPHGKKTWTLLYRFENRLYRYKLGMFPDLSLADARKKARAALGDIAKGVNPAAQRDAARASGSFTELATDYLEKYAKRKKRSWAEDSRVIDTDLLPTWAHRKVTDIRRRDVRELIERIVQRGAPTMANRVLSQIRTMFDFAVDQEWTDANPCYRLRKPTPENRRDRVLSEDDIKLLWKTLDTQPTRDAAILRLQLLTAQRIGEVMSMRWNNVDLQSRWWTVPAECAKNGMAHRVPLSSTAVEILENVRLRSGKGDWVFPAPRPRDIRRSQCVQLQTVHKTILRLRPTVNFRSHDLRHTAATYVSRELHVSREILKRILNHRDMDITARYDHNTRDGEAVRALEAWSTIVANIVSGIRAKGNVVQFTAS